MSIFDNRSSAATFKAALKQSKALFMRAGTLVKMSQLIYWRKEPAAGAASFLIETSQEPSFVQIGLAQGNENVYT